jgi:RND superfamily putative drug exporter
MLSGIGRFTYRWRFWVLGLAVAGAVAAAILGAGVSSRLSPYGANDPATQSVRATDRYQAAAHRQVEPGVIALVDSGDVGTAAARAKVEAIAHRLAAEPGVVAVSSYYSTGDPAMVSFDRRRTYLLVFFGPRSDRSIQDEAKRIEAQFAGRHDVELGGTGIANAQVNAQVSHDLAHAELLAFPFIFLLSLLFFRSAVAALLPPLLGGLAIVFTLLALRIVSSFVDMSVYALNLVTGLGLGLAIDYSLFMVSRYREEAAAGGFGRPALVRTLQTSGRTILFSSITVAVAVAALIVFPQRFLYSMGIAGALVVLLAATLALLVLPALLAALGPRVNALSPAWLARRAAREAQPEQSGFWYRLSRFVMRRPAPIAIVTATVLIVLGLPFTGIRFISATPSVLPAGASARQVQVAMNTQVPAHRGDPLDVVAGLPAASPQLAALRARIAAMTDVAAVTPAQPAGASNSLLQVVSREGPLTQASKQLVHRVRALDTPYYLGVAGTTAAYLDLESSLGRHLPIVLGIVVADTLLVLFLFTGSVILPLKAVLMNFLGLSAMLGILVLIFQDGNLQGLLGFQSEGALDATQPIFLFVLGFGLATDYGVFLLSRIKEAHDAGASNAESVSIGLERTGRIVTAAALLFAVAIGAFVTSSVVFIKELGLGTALAVLIDASIIRALLVPSLMAMLGPLNWWAPAPLRRIHRRLGLSEGDSAPRSRGVGAPGMT